MKEILLVIFFITLNSVFAQNQSDLKIHESKEYTERTKNDSIHSIYSSEYGNTVIVRNRKKEIRLDVFDKKLNKKYSESITKNRKETYIGDIFYNDELKIFTETFPKSNIRVVSCYIYNVSTNQIKKIELSNSEIDSNLALFNNKKGSVLALSPNTNFFLLSNYVIYRGEIYFNVNIFNTKTFELIYNKQLKRGENSFYSISNANITNDKEIIILGKSCYNEDSPKTLDKKKSYFLIEKYKSSSHSTLKIDFKDKYVKTLKAIIIKNKYSIYGFYSEKNFNKTKGVCNISVNLDSLNISSKTFNILPDDIYQERYGSKKAKKKELVNFNVNYILSDKENSVYILAEEFFVTCNNNSFGGGGCKSHFNDIIIVKYNKKGEIEWGKSILKKENKTTFNAFTDNENILHILLNSGKKLDTKKDGRTLVTTNFLESSALYDISFDNIGNRKIQKIKENKDKTYYSPNYGNYVDGKFIMLSSSKIIKFMSLE